MGEHDFDAGLGHGSLDARQTQTLISDIAATVRALVVLDQRYSNIPGWEKLHRGERLGWAALACALDASLEPPDYALDARGWRPNAKVITGPAKPGLLGVLQAEHNLVIRMKSFPSAMNLRLVVDSQRLLSAGLAPLAAKTDGDLEHAWLARAQTYLDLQHQLRNIGGRVGTGVLAVTEAANAVSRLRTIRPGADLDPRALHAFTTLFARLDARIADIIEAGVRRNGYFTRVTMPRIVENSGQLVAPPRHRYLPLAEGDHAAIIGLVRDRLRNRAPTWERNDRTFALDVKMGKSLAVLVLWSATYEPREVNCTRSISASMTLAAHRSPSLSRGASASRISAVTGFTFSSGSM